MIFGYFLKPKNKKKIEKKQNKTIIKDKTNRDIKTFLEEEEDYYEPARVSNFWNNN